MRGTRECFGTRAIAFASHDADVTCLPAVALLRINDHLDSADCGSGQAAPAVPSPRPATVSRSPAPPLPPLADGAPSLADVLRWQPDAAPASRRFGQNWGCAAGVLPPAQPPPPGAFLRGPDGAAVDELLALDGDDEPHAAQASLTVQRTYGLGGHLVIEDFLSPDEEAALLAAVEGPESPPWRFASFNGRSRCKDWGADMDLACVFSFPCVLLRF